MPARHLPLITTLATLGWVTLGWVTLGWITNGDDHLEVLGSLPCVFLHQITGKMQRIPATSESRSQAGVSLVDRFHQAFHEH